MTPASDRRLIALRSYGHVKGVCCKFMAFMTPNLKMFCRLCCALPHLIF